MHAVCSISVFNQIKLLYRLETLAIREINQVENEKIHIHIKAFQISFPLLFIT